MSINSLIDFLNFSQIEYKSDYSTSNLTYLEVGGYARLVIFPKCLDEFSLILNYCHERSVKFGIIGNGTNTFFLDSGYNGVIVSTKHLNKIEVKSDIIFAQCGALVTDCAIKAMQNSLCGMEFLCGIPGSVGGAITMNASAYEKSISSIVYKSTVLDLNNGITESIDSVAHEFDKKYSIFSKNKGLVVLSTEFILASSSREEIYLKMLEISKKRIKSQPLNLPSCGSTFKRPQNSYASKLIDSANLKGLSVGGAEISKKHAGFLVNKNNASSQNILDLIEETKSKIFNKFEIKLEEEILLLK
ncbi:MAG: UDP-N-acetylmuramate dehydrogenase [Clostridia bacterium]|nr:UDP-N-acetylmuramate dehydrogenase [Clostridia bacterium]